MLSFSRFLQYLDEASSSSNRLKASLTGADATKTIGHYNSYIAPFLSKAQQARSQKELAPHTARTFSAPANGELHDPSAESTHVLGSPHNGHAAGTPVRVTGVKAIDGRMHVTTQSHGTIPASKIDKIESLKKESKGKTGFAVETRIAENLGTKAAGSTKSSFDFYYGKGSGKKGSKQPAVRGKVKETEEPGKPQVRGESKLDRGKMGQGVISHNKETGWSIATGGHPAIAEHMKKARVTGPDGVERSLIDHLNHHYPDGVIKTGFSVDAPKGMSRKYLQTSNTNLLHIHNKKTDRGTTFTYGRDNELRGKTKLGHLTDSKLDSLDGKLTIEQTLSGSATISHRPRQPVMKQLANLSSTDSENHRDLSNAEHATEFRGHIDKHFGGR